MNDNMIKKIIGKIPIDAKDTTVFGTLYKDVQKLAIESGATDEIEVNGCIFFLKPQYNREKHLETVLKHIISKYFYQSTNDESKPSLIDLDGDNLYETDKELWMQLYELIPEAINAKRD
jgi:hypothetical protein